MRIDERLKEFATELEIQRIDAINETGTYNKAATLLGVSPTALKQSIALAEKRAALSGYSPRHDMSRTVPAGFKIKGVSTYYNNEGKPNGQWIKTSVDEEKRRQIIEETLKAMTDDLPRIKPSKRPNVHVDHLCNLFTMTDCHVGMLAWWKEGGADWDLKIAEQVLTGCFEQMVLGSPAASTCVVAQLGDWLHFDGMVPVTPTNHHVLDADGRLSKIIQVSVRILRRLIDFCLTRHDKVIVLLAEGNHDMVSSIWLRIMFKALYEKEPRVEVIDSDLPYYVHQHGKVMLGFHHGHLKKNDQLPLLFASQFSKTWGDTIKRYIHTGHRHHVEEKEHNGVTVVQHPTLAARDAYAARGGWIAERKVSAITYHSEHGQVAKITVTPDMLV